MKRIIKLRTSLSLSFATLTTVALLALGMALVGIFYIARGQYYLTENYHKLVNVSHHLTEQLETHVHSEPQSVEQQNAEQSLKLLLAHASSVINQPELKATLHITQQRLEQYVEIARRTPRADFNQAFQDSLLNLKEHLVELQQQTLFALESHARQTQQHSLLFALLVTIGALAILAIGYVASRNMTKRISKPIEALALCADQIGHGNFDIKLPRSKISEFVSLSRRVAAMAGALKQFKESDMQALTLGKQRLQAVLDSIDDGLLILDLQGRLQHLNPIALSQLNCTREVIGEMASSALLDANIDLQVQQILRGQALEHIPNDLVISSAHEQRLLSYRITPITQNDGLIHGAVIVLHDVTQERAFERLRQDFVLRASHELRTPVTGMQMAFGLLRERLKFVPDSREYELTQTVSNEMQRLLDLISDLLNFSRYQSGLQILSPSPCQIGDIIEHAVARTNAPFQEKHLTLKLDIPKALPELFLDKDLIIRVVEHLLVNAIRHSPLSAEINVQVRQHGQRLVVSVEDQGDGIPFDQQLRIFEPFVQVGSKKGGVGLGLALCKEIIQLHGGRIGVYSKPESGTQFYFALPFTTSVLKGQ